MLRMRDEVEDCILRSGGAVVGIGARIGAGQPVGEPVEVGHGEVGRGRWIVGGKEASPKGETLLLGHRSTNGRAHRTFPYAVGSESARGDYASSEWPVP